MNVQEMETAYRLKLPIVVLLWEDHEYGLIAWKQQNHFGRHTDLSFTNPDWVKLAESFNWRGVRVENSRDLRGALDDALAADVPSLITIPIDYRENALLSERLGHIACSI